MLCTGNSKIALVLVPLVDVILRLCVLNERCGLVHSGDTNVWRLELPFLITLTLIHKSIYLNNLSNYKGNVLKIYAATKSCIIVSSNFDVNNVSLLYFIMSRRMMTLFINFK